MEKGLSVQKNRLAAKISQHPIITGCNAGRSCPRTTEEEVSMIKIEEVKTTERGCDLFFGGKWAHDKRARAARCFSLDARQDPENRARVDRELEQRLPRRRISLRGVTWPPSARPR